MRKKQIKKEYLVDYTFLDDIRKIAVRNISQPKATWTIDIRNLSDYEILVMFSNKEFFTGLVKSIRKGGEK